MQGVGLRVITPWAGSTSRKPTPLRWKGLEMQAAIAKPVAPTVPLQPAQQRLLVERAMPALHQLDTWKGQAFTANSLVNQVYRALYPRERGVIIYGGSRAKPDNPEYKLAYDLGQALAKAGFYVVSGGGKGVMEASAQGSRDAGGHAMGAGFSQFKESNTQLHREFVFHQSAISDRIYGPSGYESRGAYTVVFPGKIGTEIEFKQKLVELFTNATPYPSQRQLIFMDLNGTFTKQFIKPLERDIRKGQAYAGLRPLITVAHNVNDVMKALQNESIPWTPGLN